MFIKSFVFINILRDKNATLGEVAKVVRAIEKQFVLFVAKKDAKAKRPVVRLEHLHLEDAFEARLFCECEDGLFDEINLHKEFTEYCEHIVNFILQPTEAAKGQIEITNQELDNFAKIIAFAEDGNKITINYSQKQEDGRFENQLSVDIDIDNSEQSDNGVSKKSIASIRGGRKRDVIVELKNQQICFSIVGVFFEEKKLKIKLDSFKLGDYDLNSVYAYTEYTDILALKIMTFNKEQGLEWQMCKPVVEAEIKLVNLVTDTNKDADEFKITHLVITKVLLQDIGEGENASLLNAMQTNDLEKPIEKHPERKLENN